MILELTIDNLWDDNGRLATCVEVLLQEVAAAAAKNVTGKVTLEIQLRTGKIERGVVTTPHVIQ